MKKTILKNKIKFILEEKGMSGMDLVRELNKTSSTIYELINREDISETRAATLVEISKFLDCKIEDLFEETTIDND